MKEIFKKLGYIRLTSLIQGFVAGVATCVGTYLILTIWGM